jgi:uncharacterized protein
MADGPLPRRPLQGGLGRRLLGLLLAVFMAAAAAQELVAVPPLKERVTDATGTLSPATVAQLDASLKSFEERKGVQIAVLMVRSTAPEPIEQYALRVVEQWKLGRRRVDDGALLLVARDDRAVRIEVGYGIEGALSDIVSRRIIDEQITPRFRTGDFDGGITAGVDQMMRVVDGEALPAPSGRAQPSSGEPGQIWPFVVVVAVALGGVLRRMLGRVGGALVVGGVLGGLAWFAVGTLVTAAMAGLAGFFLTLLGIGMGGFVGGLPGRRGGGGWSGGGGGGGFSGGGGGFGGGGASGRW